MRRLAIIALGALALSGCVKPSGGPGPGKPVPIEGDSVRYETGPCYGRCPVYAVTVHPDGTGVFEGKRFTAVTGEKPFTLSRAQYDAFVAKLAPYRPESGQVRYAPGQQNCQPAATDASSVNITWTRAIGDSQGLYFYYGCRAPANLAIGQALGEASEALPIQDLIGERP
jgi:hypothetical protein